MATERLGIEKSVQETDFTEACVLHESFEMTAAPAYARCLQALGSTVHIQPTTFLAIHPCSAYLSSKTSFCLLEPSW